MNYEAREQDAQFAASASAAKLSQIPTPAIACQNPFGNTLQTQLLAAGLKQISAAILDERTHWVFEENPEPTLRALMERQRSVVAKGEVA